MFNRIQAENFLSWENLDFKITKGISQITGWNHDDETSEGSGKSSILNALSWGLYGKIPKDANIDDVIRDGAESCSATITLESGDKVLRSRSPNTLKIITKDGFTRQGKDAKETQQFINKQVGMDFDAFCQTVYFAQNYPNKFLSANEADKASILSEIQDLDIYDRARKHVQTLIKDAEIRLRVLENELIKLQANETILENRVSDLNDRIKTEEERSTTRQNNLEKEIESLKSELAGLQKELKSADQTLPDHLKHTNELIEVLVDKRGELVAEIKSNDANKALIASLKSSIASGKGRIESLKEELADFSEESLACPTCGAGLPPEKAQPIIAKFERKKSQVTALEAEVAETAKRLSKVKVVDVKDTQNILAELDLELNNLRKEAKEIAANILKNERLAEKASSTTKVIAEKTKEKSIKIDTAMDKYLEQLTKLNKEWEDAGVLTLEKGMEISEEKELIIDLEILRDGYKEIKSYVFQSILKDLSTKSTAMMSELFGQPAKVLFTNTSDTGGVSKIQTIVTMDGTTRKLGLLSGGQYRRVELAVDLALATIVSNRNKHPIKFRIFDEPFKDLSSTSMERAIKLLKNLEGSTIIIEHNSIVNSIIDNTFHVDLKNGISRHAS